MNQKELTEAFMMISNWSRTPSRYSNKSGRTDWDIHDDFFPFIQGIRKSWLRHSWWFQIDPKPFSFHVLYSSISALQWLSSACLLSGIYLVWVLPPLPPPAVVLPAITVGIFCRLSFYLALPRQMSQRCYPSSQLPPLSPKECDKQTFQAQDVEPMLV